MRWLFSSLLLLAACGGGDAKPRGTSGFDATRHVDPMIGTRGSGNVVPGPSLPHGMVKLSPDTHSGIATIEGYEYGDGEIEGFSHTHLEGPGGGANGLSQLLLQPVVGRPGFTEARYASSYSHDDEQAEPGYYAVTLDDYGVRVELTATQHVGLHRYTFPRSDESRVLIDVSHSRGLAMYGWVEIVDDRTVRGYGLYDMHPLVAVATFLDPGTTAASPLYFHATFDRPFESFGTWSGTSPTPGSRRAEGADIGAFLDFATQEGDVVQVKVGISAIDVDQARASLQREVSGFDFDRVRERARQTWNEVLSRIQIETGSDEDLKRFYTALYHTLLQASDFDEYGRFWSGADGFGAVFDAEPGFRFHADDWCLWDTFRTSHPLQELVEPERRASIIGSYLHLFEQGGWLPKCTWRATGYSRVMIGNHATCMIADGYAKGTRDFDVERAYEAMRKAATEDNRNLLSNGLCGFMNLGTPPEYVELGYVPLECDLDQAVSMTLEYAYDDACLATMAAELGHEEDARIFTERAGNYRNVWNPEHGFMQSKLRSGEWDEPFDPTSTVGFTEADSWKYTWFVPQDIPGLIGLVGGRSAFVEKLDAFFAGGHYDSSNQPDYHVPYLYAHAGAAWATQALVRELMETEFATDPGGLPGNDDAGSTSAWFVWSALGLYPVTPGQAIYTIGSPLFERVAIDVQGSEFVIEAAGNAPDHAYIQSATLNGRALERAWIRHDELTPGGVLRLEMGAAPSAWATDPAQAPPAYVATQGRVEP